MKSILITVASLGALLTASVVSAHHEDMTPVRVTEEMLEQADGTYTYMTQAMAYLNVLDILDEVGCGEIVDRRVFQQLKEIAVMPFAKIDPLGRSATMWAESQYADMYHLYDWLRDEAGEEGYCLEGNIFVRADLLELRFEYEDERFTDLGYSNEFWANHAQAMLELYVPYV